MAMPRGRPRLFNRDEAIDKAMLLFWKHGYEATSLAQLRESIGGISAASFYAAFESKEALFKQAVDRYWASHGRAVAPLWDVACSPKKGLEQALRNSARMQTQQAHPFGCLLVIGASACSAENAHIQTLLGRERERTRAGVRSCLERARERGEIPAEKNIAALATLFESFLFGMTIQARDDTPFTSLDSSITEMMTLLGGP